MLGIATGAGYALAASLAKACIDLLEQDWIAVLTDWRLYALAAVGLVSVVLNQNAFQAGMLAGALTGIVLTDPLASVVIGIAAYQEAISSGAVDVVLELLAVAVMATGVWLVSAGRSARCLTAPPLMRSAFFFTMLLTTALSSASSPCSTRPPAARCR